MKTFMIEIEGLVQGVGFRPFVYKLASSMGLEGTVENINRGVRVILNCSNGSLDMFVDRIGSEAPVQAHVESILVNEIPPAIFKGFLIKSSNNLSQEVTRISPDIAVCDDCLADMEGQEHRIAYPLINCTNCGPRFSIIKGVPYDRPMTSMEPFEMCARCRKEYNDPHNRRFHAQPVACNNCGPVYSMLTGGGELNSVSDISRQAARIIDDGGILALKGTGGYHLVCDAMNEEAVALMREAKVREGKPFAVMCRDKDHVNKIARPGPEELETLYSWQRPVLIMESRNLVAPSVSNGLDTVGVIMPYMPFHYLLFGKLKTGVIVFTSANLAEEPVITNDEEARIKLGNITDAVIKYNRDIYNRTDDSVGRFIAGELRILRRSRGYAPTPLKIDFDAEGIFGAGAELTNCFGMGKGKNLILSQHIGDLKNAATLEFYNTAYKRFAGMFRFRPGLVARDLHPDYLSSVFAEKIAGEEGIPLTMVQHHHAHVASCMAENNVKDKVIGVLMDGIGLGSDGRIWGGEFIIADLCDFNRVLHFDYVPLAGGDYASSEPWRSGLSYLIKYLGGDEIRDDIPLVRKSGHEQVRLYTELLNKGINTAYYSSAGRLFDAVAAITGLCYSSKFHAEAPMRLEAAVSRGINSHYEYDISGEAVSFGKAIREIVYEMKEGVSPGDISARFHNTVAMAIMDGIRYVSDRSGLKGIVLSGGTFQNRYLAEKLISELKAEKFYVYFNRHVPVNDGGLALGQVAVAAARRDAGLI
ncbi:MAG: carbamoyltransferase HypF [Bacteroidales bacterium]|nr:carbamoyltransferase HypF [Bacteroidales bacterium]